MLVPNATPPVASHCNLFVTRFSISFISGHIAREKENTKTINHGVVPEAVIVW